MREHRIYTEIAPYFESIDSIKSKNPRGIILSGGPASVYEEDTYKPDSRIFELGVPLLGICYGMQYIAHFFGGKVVRAQAQEFGRAKVMTKKLWRHTDKNGVYQPIIFQADVASIKTPITFIYSQNVKSQFALKLFCNAPEEFVVWMSHADKVESIPEGFEAIAESENTGICAMANTAKRIYALQFHPEVVHSECGGEILKNFALRVCGADNSWNMKNFAESEIAKLRKKVFGLGSLESRADIKGDTLLDSKPSGEEVLRNEKDCVSSKASSASETNSCVSLSNTESRIRENSKADSAAGFCDDFVGCDDFEMRSLLDINDEVAKSNSRKSAQKPTQKVLCAVSGGVDSSVVAILLYRAIGENLIPVFVDTGLLRKGEREAVEAMFRKNLKAPLIVVDASSLFLSRLKGVLDPEKKRKIIGETFIEVFESEAKKHNTQGEIKFLAQGTLYPDVIESVSVKGPSKTIKSHHNVGGLPEWMKFELIEPLRELFKDEVRSLGRELGMPESMLMRHPFPGPGLAIRIMGEVNEGDLGLLREADSIFTEELHRAGLYNSVWQEFCVLLNVRSVGVMDDNRTYDNTICLRAVEAQDGMTASFSHLPCEFLESVSNRIINEVAGINRVVYDITSKPPGTDLSGGKQHVFL